MKLLKQGLTLRGDHYYCPIPFQLSTYWNCENACNHCYLRRLNRTWGEDLRPLDIDNFMALIENGVKNRNPKSPLSVAIASRKTVYLGAKSDPYQTAEVEYRCTRKALQILLHHGFSVVIATMFTELMERDRRLLEQYRSQVTIMPIISPGLDKDWEILEKRGTTRPVLRLRDAQNWLERGFNVGVNGEPFIPGFHTVEEFENIIRLLKKAGIKSYNIYNLHFNDWNAKKMHEAGIDIEEVWEGNQDNVWRGTLKKLISIAQEYDIILGCPDFVNSGSYTETSNTCCGIQVPNPCTFNVINWKKLRLQGIPDEEILKRTWDGVGDYEYGKKLLSGQIDNMFSLKDIVE